MTHPSLGRPPRDLTAGRPSAAGAIQAARSRLAARALEIAVDRDPTIRARYDEIGLRRLLNDAEVLLGRVAVAVASDDPAVVASWAEQVPPVYRRRAVPMDDLVALADGCREAIEAILPPGDEAVAAAALEEAARVFRWHRRLGGDARRRNRLLHAIYKGA